MSEDPSYGIRQLTESTWAAYGGKTSDPAEQSRLGLEYAKARYGVTDQADPGWYSQGGYIAGAGIAYLGPDECLIRMTNMAAFRLRCCRAGHPTATSDCGKPGATIEPPEETV